MSCGRIGAAGLAAGALLAGAAAAAQEPGYFGPGTHNLIVADFEQAYRYRVCNPAERFELNLSVDRDRLRVPAKACIDIRGRRIEIVWAVDGGTYQNLD